MFHCCFNSSNHNHVIDDNHEHSIRIDKNHNIIDSSLRSLNLSVIVESSAAPGYDNTDHSDNDDYDDLMSLSPHSTEPSLPPSYIYRNDLLHNKENFQRQEIVLNEPHDVISNSRSENNLSPMTPSNENVDKKNKYDEIIECLNGDNGIVNLWKLREFALSYGGLLCPILRKRAWPILTQLHCDVLISTTSTTPLSPSVSSHYTNTNRMIIPSISIHDTHLMKKDLKLIKHVNETYYDNNMYDDGNDNIEQHSTTMNTEDMTTKHKLHQLSLYNIIVMTLEQKLSLSKTINNSSSNSLITSPTIPTTNTTTLAKHIIDIHMDHNDNDEVDDEDFDVVISSSSSTCSSIGNDSIKSISGTSNAENINNNKVYVSSYRYYEGLTDITNVLYTNLQSASLTTLLLTKLVKHHLRDAFRPSRSMMHSEATTSLKPIETAVMLLFIPLLRIANIDIYNELIVHACSIYHPNGLIGGIETLSGIIAKHVSTWFCNAFYYDNNNNKRRTSTEHMMIISSRISDVCIASHPLIPIYIVVAILSIRKKYNNGNLLLYDWNNSKQEFHIQIENLFYLDTIIIDNDDIILLEDVVEQIIHNAIQYMKLISTESLLEIATATSTTTTCCSPRTANKNASSRYASDVIGKLKYRNITLLREVYPPKWCTSHYTPTEWTLLQCKQKKNRTPLSIPNDCNPQHHYPKAYCVSGIRSTSSSSSVFKNKLKRLVSGNNKKDKIIATSSEETIMFEIRNRKDVVRSRLFLLLLICTIILFASLDVCKIDRLQVTRQLLSSNMATLSRESLKKYSCILRSALPTERVTNVVNTMQMKSSLLFHSVATGKSLSTFSHILENGLDSTKMGYKKIITRYEYHTHLIEKVHISRIQIRSLVNDADLSIRSFVNNHSRISMSNKERLLSVVSVPVVVISHRPIFMNNITNGLIEFQKTSSHYIERIENMTHIRSLSSTMSSPLLLLSSSQQQNIKMKNTAVMNHTSLRRRQQLKKQASSNQTQTAAVICTKDLGIVPFNKPKTRHSLYSIPQEITSRNLFLLL